jgi:hypothetical protein
MTPVWTTQYSLSPQGYDLHGFVYTVHLVLFFCLAMSMPFIYLFRIIMSHLHLKLASTPPIPQYIVK